MIVLRDVARRWQAESCQGEARSLDVFLDNWITEHLGDGWKGKLADYLRLAKGPRPVFLVDGWDELGPLGEEFRSKLIGLIREFPHVLVIVTSRPYGEGRPTGSEGFSILDIQPLSDSEISRFAHTFYQRCYSQDPSASEYAPKFLTALGRSPDARGLARTALLLTMMLLISRSRPLPDKRHLLYQACIENLLTALPDRREEEGVLLLADQWRPENSEERFRVVAELAFQIQNEGYQDSGRGAIVRSWENLSGFLPQSWPVQDRRRFLNWLAGPAGLLVDRADETVAFAHLSFQEYLAAWHLDATVEGDGERRTQFALRVAHHEWWETLRLWAALIEAINPSRLRPVIEALQRGDNHGFWLAGAIFADGPGSTDLFQEWVTHISERLIYSYPEGADLTAAAWAGSQQVERGGFIGNWLADKELTSHWTHWHRLSEWLRSCGIDVVLRPLPQRDFTTLTAALLGDAQGREAVALGRVFGSFRQTLLLSGAPSFLLRLWPSRRYELGRILQTAAVLSCNRDDLLMIASKVLQNQTTTSAVGTIDVRADRKAVRRLEEQFEYYLPRLDRFEPHATAELAIACCRSRWGNIVPIGDGAPEDLIAYLLRREITGWMEEERGDGLLAEKLRIAVREIHPLHLYRAAAHDIASHYGYVGPHSVDLGALDLVELSSAILVSLLPALPGDRWPEARLLADVLSDSPGQRRFDTALLWDVHPLWQALARVLGDAHAEEDLKYLQAVATNPNQLDEPLRSAVKYLVRGDVLMSDGSTIELDEIVRELSRPKMPYLDLSAAPLVMRVIHQRDRSEPTLPRTGDR